jgi:lysyl-tRNA synthetase class 2
VIENLRERALQLAAVRRFFFDRNVTEVDTSLLRPTACVDAHIDLIECAMQEGTWYLHSSPEYEMKKLLAAGIGDCYQLSHVFRYGERGSQHLPEFALIEWYRCGMNLETLIEETLLLTTTITGKRPTQRLSYRELFLLHLQVDPFSATNAELTALLSPDMRHSELEAEGRDGLLNLLLGLLIEPNLDEEKLTVIYRYPASQCALAQVVDAEEGPVAERFEIYGGGMELANGYHELRDPDEQLRRLESANAKRIKLEKKPYPIDPAFIASLAKGIPDCCGVAVGFDRLMMLRQKETEISQVICNK